MVKSMPTLRCERVRFYSEGDESSFFSFARSIPAVKRIEGAGDSILLRTTNRPSQRSLRDLHALFIRYRISGKQQLDQFSQKS